jgi:hypothetical protein
VNTDDSTATSESTKNKDTASTVIENVEKMTQNNNIGPVESLAVINHFHPGSKQETRVIVKANETHLSGEQKTEIARLVNRLGDLLIRSNRALDADDKGKWYGIARKELNKHCNETTINTFPKTKYPEAVSYLNDRINYQLDNKYVIGSPPEWWREELIGRIHSNVAKNQIHDEQYRSRLWEKYGKRSSQELEDCELAEFWKYSIKGKFSPVKEIESSRDFNQRIRALDDYLESIGGFDRPDIGMGGPELLSRLQERSPEQWNMTPGSFTKWILKAKKDMRPFKLRTGRPVTLKDRRRG